MNTLEAQFLKKGVTFTQVFREGDLAIFEAKRASGSRWWETVIIKEKKAGKGYTRGDYSAEPSEAYESYPSDEQIGKIGWACVSLARAEEKLDEIKRIRKGGKPVVVPKVKSGRKGGRKPVLKDCVGCGTKIYTGQFQKFKGKCPECFKKLALN